MDNLDDLAAAAKTARATPSARKTRQFKKTSRTPLISGIIVVIVIIGIYVFTGTSGPSGAPDLTVNREVVTNGPFTWIGWSFKSNSTAPIVIRRVVYNAEWIAPVGEVARGGAILYKGPQQAPTTLTIGDTAYYYQGQSVDQSIPTYVKDVVFVDVDTPSGVFRYNNGMLVGRVPSTDVANYESNYRTQFAAWKSRDAEDQSIRDEMLKMKERAILGN